MVILGRFPFLRPVLARGVIAIRINPPGAIEAIDIGRSSRDTQISRKDSDLLVVGDGGRTAIRRGGEEPGPWHNVYDHKDSNTAEITRSGEKDRPRKTLLPGQREVIDLGDGITAEMFYQGRLR